MSSAHDAELRLAQQALEKQSRDERLTRDETRALKRVQERREEKLRQQFYRSIPQKHWLELAGIARSQLKVQAQRYRLPFFGKTIDLAELLPALHRFLAEYAKTIDMDGEGVGKSSLEELRQEQVKLTRLKRRRAEGELLPKADVLDGLSIFAGRIKRAGEILQKRFGSDAQEILDDALDDALASLRTLDAHGN